MEVARAEGATDGSATAVRPARGQACGSATIVSPRSQAATRLHRNGSNFVTHPMMSYADVLPR